MRIDYRRSLTVAQAIQSKTQNCWQNAATALLHYFKGKGFYVEGIAVWNGIPMEHGWIEVSGTIIDPTWIVGDVSVGETIAYYPIFSYTAAEIIPRNGQRMPFYMACTARLQQVISRKKELIASLLRG